MNSNQSKQKRKGTKSKRNGGSTRKQQPKQRNGQQRQVAAPIALGSISKIAGPRYRSSKNGSVCISHRELIGDLDGTTMFSALKTQINPGLSTMFPWLSSIATNYESYKFKRLKFHYVPACPTTAPGVMYLVVEFDPQDPVPASERQIASYDGAVTGSVWSKHDYDCAPRNLNKRTSYFVRNGTVPDSDLPLYDTGYLVSATTGNTDSSTLGKLWVDYEIELSTPQLNDLAVGNSLSMYSTGAGKVAPTNTGNAPLTSSASAGLVTYVATAPYDCLFAYNIAGSALANPPIGGTAVNSPKAVVLNAGSTVSVGQYSVSFKEGDTFTVDLSTSTTVTNYFNRFAQYNVAFG